MHPVIKELLILQERDQKLLIVQRDLDRIPRDEANANGQLNGDQQVLQKAIDALRQCEVATKKIELDIATRRNTILRLKQQQFETRKNEEYTALGNEVIRYTKEIDGLETQELEHMEIADNLRAKVKEAEAQLARSQSLVNADLADLTASRPFYQSRNLIVKPFAGLRAAWIRQTLTIAMEESPISRNPPLPPQPVYSNNNSHSWAVGPRIGVGSQVLLPVGLSRRIG